MLAYTDCAKPVKNAIHGVIVIQVPCHSSHMQHQGVQIGQARLRPVQQPLCRERVQPSATVERSHRDRHSYTDFGRQDRRASVCKILSLQQLCSAGAPEAPPV